MAMIGGNLGPTIRSIVERVEKLEGDKKEIGDDIKEIYSEAKGNGFDIITLKEVIRLRKLDTSVRENREHTRDVYLSAMGLLDIPE